MVPKSDILIGVYKSNVWTLLCPHYLNRANAMTDGARGTFIFFYQCYDWYPKQILYFYTDCVP